MKAILNVKLVVDAGMEYAQNIFLLPLEPPLEIWDINITAQATLPLLKEVKFFAQNRKRQVTSSNVKIT